MKATQELASDNQEFHENSKLTLTLSNRGRPSLKASGATPLLKHQLNKWMPESQANEEFSDPQDPSDPENKDRKVYKKMKRKQAFSLMPSVDSSRSIATSNQAASDSPSLLSTFPIVDFSPEMPGPKRFCRRLWPNCLTGSKLKRPVRIYHNYLYPFPLNTDLDKIP
jgi:hypothetical protein